jgi:hypothetical protein
MLELGMKEGVRELHELARISEDEVLGAIWRLCFTMGREENFREGAKDTKSL